MNYARPSVLVLVREALRRKVRQLFLSWLVCAVILFVLLNSTPAGYDAANIYIAVPLALIVCPMCWFLYRLMRFAIAH